MHQPIMYHPIFEWVWASTFIWFLEPIPQNRTPWRFWSRLILWAPIAYLMILPICIVLALFAIVGMCLYAGLFRLHILRVGS